MQQDDDDNGMHVMHANVISSWTDRARKRYLNGCQIIAEQQRKDYGGNKMEIQIFIKLCVKNKIRTHVDQLNQLDILQKNIR